MNEETYSIYSYNKCIVSGLTLLECELWIDAHSYSENVYEVCPDNGLFCD